MDENTVVETLAPGIVPLAPEGEAVGTPVAEPVIWADETEEVFLQPEELTGEELTV